MYKHVEKGTDFVFQGPCAENDRIKSEETKNEKLL